ncbi:cell cycle checkpoint protein RAD17-like [Prunus avium]|uniref:Cell cycle checkpoint protein RAD17-like n=1 Tax=Prunus avium TaxID=42229 RepID=A0A6P5SF19_PRUAV|nr:cell cycle checkpoint protein RAD17-like [Prunus avium]
MGKRNTVVVLSSDEEDRDRSSSANRRCTPTKLTSTVPRTNPRRSKRARVSSSRASLGTVPSNWDEVKLFCEDFDEVFSGFKVSAGSGRSNVKELWVDKYKPRSFEELAVHKKKVEEVKLWFEERLTSSKKEMVKRRFGAYSGMCASDLTVIATEYTPVLKWLGFRAVHGYKEEDNVETISFDSQETEISDDEIEEW